MKRSKKKPPIDLSALSETEKKRYDALASWRAEKAKSRNLANFVFALNTQLADVAKLNPSTLEELSTVKGFPESRVKKYGAEIIAVLKSM